MGTPTLYPWFMEAQAGDGGGEAIIVENLMIDLEAGPEVEVDDTPVVVDVSADIVVTLDEPVDVEVDVG